jgi:DNA-binding NarL/FixJ family response regulator
MPRGTGTVKSTSANASGRANAARADVDTTLRVALACADPELRDRLAKQLCEQPGTAVAEVRSDTVAIFRLIEQVHPDLVLVDAPSPAFLLDWRRRQDGEAALVVLLDDSDSEDRIIEALGAGARGVLPRTCDAGDIVDAVKLVANGYTVLPTQLLSRLIGASQFADRGGTDGDADRIRLTPRERDVLAAMADGASNKAIARRLGISFHTAKFHVAAVLAKLDADSRTEAVAKAAQLGLVML